MRNRLSRAPREPTRYPRSSRATRDPFASHLANLQAIGRVHPHMASSATDNAEVERTTLAKSLAPEEVRAGDWVAVLYEVQEYTLLTWECDVPPAERDEVVRVAITPDDGGEPLEVKAVCLPFVLVKPHKGKLRQIDVRRNRLARLDPSFAKVWITEKKRRKKK